MTSPESNWTPIVWSESNGSPIGTVGGCKVLLEWCVLMCHLGLGMFFFWFFKFFCSFFSTSQSCTILLLPYNAATSACLGIFSFLIATYIQLKRHVWMFIHIFFFFLSFLRMNTHMCVFMFLFLMGYLTPVHLPSPTTTPEGPKWCVKTHYLGLRSVFFLINFFCLSVAFLIFVALCIYSL